jgi:hypothetical protein
MSQAPTVLRPGLEPRLLETVLTSVRAELENTPMSASSLQATLPVLLAALAVAACGSVEQTMIERGFPPAYAEGFADGCASGKEAAGGWFVQARKDTRRYGADGQYTAGWDDGFEECRRDMTAMVRHARIRNRNRDK